MAKIIYGLCGQGSGHGSRSKEVISHLISQGHEVKIFTYKQGFDLLKNFFPVEKIFGLLFDYKDNKVRLLPTLYKNALQLPEANKSLRLILKKIDQWQPDLVITDFEPLVCVAANLKRLPLISIDNQHFLTETKVNYPKNHEKDVALAKAVVKAMVFNTKANLVISFLKAKTKNKKTFVFPPILRQEVLETKPQTKDHVLVYVTSANPELEDTLKKVKQKFICYGFGKKGQEGNLTFKLPNQKQFFDDLATCRAVVGNAGFTLIGEALYLGKPYLAWPVKSQFEQIMNAYFIEKLGYGLYAENLDLAIFERFFKGLTKFTKKLKKYPREGNTKILKKLDGLIKKYS